MGRYLGGVCRQCRREGMKLFLKGDRCNMSKCAVEQGRAAPGMHGMRRSKASDYAQQFREKQRLRRMYGMQDGQFRVFFEKAARHKGVTGDILLQMLEMRLDNLAFRLGYAASRRAARQFVLHEHVNVNGRKATIPSMILKKGDVIEVRDRPASRSLAKRTLDANEGKDVKPWLTLDRAGFRGEVIRIPSRDEIAPIVNEQLVVELCSK
ncbi:MAG: 30S ribosomal protein S4 [Lentisphaerae bacterium]|nr:30S ribosomal protein S4 [Lentisphaerota bacterium]